jgi:hypothetical protein
MTDGGKKARFRFACGFRAVARLRRGAHFPNLIAQAFELALIGTRAATETPQGK